MGIHKSNRFTTILVLLLLGLSVSMMYHHSSLRDTIDGLIVGVTRED